MQIRTIIVLLFTLSLSVLPVKAGVEVQPRIVTLKDKVESLESEYGVRFVYSSDINLERRTPGCIGKYCGIRQCRRP